MGELYYDFGDHVAAAGYFSSALENITSDTSLTIRSALYSRLAMSLILQGDKNSTKTALRKLETLVADSSPELRVPQALLLATEGKLTKSSTQYRHTIADTTSTYITPNIKIAPAIELIRQYNNRNIPDSGRIWIERSRTYAMQSSLYWKIAWYKEGLRVFTLTGEADSALRYQNSYFLLYDSLVTESNFLQLSHILKKEEEIMTRKHIANLRATSSARQWILIGILIPIAIYILWIYLRRYQKQSRRRFILLDKAFQRLQGSRIRTYDRAYLSTISDSTDQTSGNTVSPIRTDLFSRIDEMVSHPDVFCDPNLSLPRVAEALCCNTKYISAAIKDATGFNFRSYINDYRIREARRRLLDTNSYGHLTIQGIAASVGFKSPSAFIAAFRQFTGMTPSCYIRMASETL